MARFMFVFSFVVILVILSVNVTADANLILNGSFESGPPLDYEPGMWANVYPPSTAITNWTVIYSNLNYIGPYWQASDGTHSLDLNGQSGPGGIEQSFATVIGQEYTVSFDLAGNPSDNPDNVPAIKWLRVAAAGDSADFSFDITGKSRAAMGYENHTWQFTAVDTTTTLQFISLDPTQKWGPVLDNVTLVPEPATILLLGAGGLAFLLQRRKG